MLFSILLIVLGIICIAGVGRLIWHLVRGPDAQQPGKNSRHRNRQQYGARQEAFPALLLNRLYKRRTIKHPPWSPRQRTRIKRRAIKRASWSLHRRMPPSPKHGYYDNWAG